jgi:hypothetical protein
LTAFFIPEAFADGGSAETVYRDFKRAAHARTDHEPLADRIFKLFCRRGGVDCEAEVGKPDPVTGETVVAILDLGRGAPYVIGCASPGGAITHVLVEKPVYAVTRFAPTA